MTQVLVILDSNTLNVVDWYFSDSPIVPVTPGVTLPVPDGLSWDVVKGQKDPETSEVTLVADPMKISGRTESLWSALRAQRNQLLAASDWTQGNDSPLSTESKSAWAAYRAALRNLPDVTTDPLNPTWPQSP